MPGVKTKAKSHGSNQETPETMAKGSQNRAKFLASPRIVGDIKVYTIPILHKMYIYIYMYIDIYLYAHLHLLHNKKAWLNKKESVHGTANLHFGVTSGSTRL